MQVLRLILPLAAAAALTASPAAGRGNDRPQPTSWGKPGVSLDQYAIDAGVCAWRAINMDIARSEPARRLVSASRALEHAERVAWMEMPALGTPSIGVAGNPGREFREAIDRYRPDVQFAAIREMQYGALEGCLAGLGYSRFRLTQDQARELRRLRRGSVERRAFLHRLGSDPDVLARQAVE